MPVHTISVYLLRADLQDVRSALRDEAANLSTHAVRASNGVVGTLYVAEGEEGQPEWVRFLSTYSDPPLTYQTSSLSAVLLLQASERWFAITYGYGRFLLEPESFERSFGLRAALNAVDPEKLRAVQARTFHEYALHTQRQLSRLSTIEVLELDTQRDLVTALAGDVGDTGLGIRIDGRDAVRLSGEILPEDFGRKCSDLLALSQRTDYREHFPWVDNVELIRDPVEIARLDGIAFSALGRRQFSRFDLYPPELVPDEIVEFRLDAPGARANSGGTRVAEPTPTLLRLPLRNPLSSGQAKEIVFKYRLRGLDANDQVAAEWRLGDCLYFEYREASGVSILDGGQWYRIKQEFADEVATFAAGLSPSALGLPESHRGEKEETYNRRAAEADSLALLDQNLIRLPRQSGIEPCDLFSNDRHFVHVKRRKGGSGPFSHLLGQAFVSAEAFVSDRQFQDALREKLEVAKAGFGTLVEEVVDARRYTIVLALITAPAEAANPADHLPFFSKVYLRLVVRRLQAMGFTVCVDGIPARAMPRPSRAPSRVRREGPAADRRSPRPA
jgi:uncharacterized protein (TIGR04141 family)